MSYIDDLTKSKNKDAGTSFGSSFFDNPVGTVFVKIQKAIQSLRNLTKSEPKGDKPQHDNALDQFKSMFAGLTGSESKAPDPTSPQSNSPLAKTAKNSTLPTGGKLGKNTNNPSLSTASQIQKQRDMARAQQQGTDQEKQKQQALQMAQAIKERESF
jgi:hypothetical protein